jgi:hypothetical protein
VRSTTTEPTSAKARRATSRSGVRRRRRHPARAARIAATGAAATAVLAITAGLGFAGRVSGPAAQNPTADASPSGLSPTLPSQPGRDATQVVPPATPAPVVTSGPPAAVTRGSR